MNYKFLICAAYMRIKWHKMEKNSMSIFNNKHEIYKFLMHYSVFLRDDKKHDCVTTLDIYIYMYIYICIYVYIYIYMCVCAYIGRHKEKIFNVISLSNGLFDLYKLTRVR